MIDTGLVVCQEGPPLRSKPGRLDPEALLPRLPGRDVLQLLINALLREVHRVGDTGHRLEADEVLRRPGREPDYRRFVIRTERYFDLLGLALDPHCGSAVGVADEVAEKIVELQAFQRAALRLLRQKLPDRLRLQIGRASCR